MDEVGDYVDGVRVLGVA